MGICIQIYTNGFQFIMIAAHNTADVANQFAGTVAVVMGVCKINHLIICICQLLKVVRNSICISFKTNLNNFSVFTWSMQYDIKTIIYRKSVRIRTMFLSI